MNTFSKKSDRSMLEKSEPLRRARDTLERYFAEQKAKGGQDRVFSANRLYDLVGEVGMVHLAWLLSLLVEDKVLDQIIRVELEPSLGLQDFHSIEDVPDEIADWRGSGDSFRVTPDHLRVYYRLHSDAS